MQFREKIEGATGAIRSAAIATGNRLQSLTSQLRGLLMTWMTVLGTITTSLMGRLKTTSTTVIDRIRPLTSWLAERLQPLTALLKDLAAVVADAARSTALTLIDRTRPLAAWTAERLQPWTALLKDAGAVVADAARSAAATAADWARPLVTRVTDRFGVRMTAIGAATAVFVGSTGSTAWAITSMETPVVPSESVAVASADETATPEDQLTAEEEAAVLADAGAEAEAQAQAEAEAQAQAEAEAEAEAAEEAKPVEPDHVGGLNEDQMDNAVAIIEAGKDEGLDRDGWAVALATAMQESKFKNYANEGLPESFEYDYQAVGSDHDSVGLFQQRPASGWGSVEELMDPKTSASKFYKALKNVDDWEDMPVTKAAQTVQVSAFPDAYAQWVELAYDIIESYEEANS